MIDVIILAGGRGSRMGGVDKARVVVDGERLIDILLDEVSLIDGLMQVVVVTTRGLEVRPGVKVVAEDPPFSGPVAAIAAGVDALRDHAARRTAILAVDAPESATLVPALSAALTSPYAAAAVEGQPLCAVWDTAALHEALRCLGSVTDRAARSLFDGVAVATVEGDGAERDYDTLTELAEYGDVEAGDN